MITYEFNFKELSALIITVINMLCGQRFVENWSSHPCAFPSCLLQCTKLLFTYLLFSLWQIYMEKNTHLDSPLIRLYIIITYSIIILFITVNYSPCFCYSVCLACAQLIFHLLLWLLGLSSFLQPFVILSFSHPLLLFSLFNFIHILTSSGR